MAHLPHHLADDAADAAALEAAKSSAVGFDDIATGKKGIALVQPGYGGVDWSDMYAFDPEKSFGHGGVSGTGLFVAPTSGHQCALNGYGYPALVYVGKGTFTLDSVEMTAAYDKKAVVEFYALDSEGNVKYDIMKTITDAHPKLFKLDLQDIVNVGFYVHHEERDPRWKKLGDIGAVIGFDDFVFSKIDPRGGDNSAILHRFGIGGSTPHALPDDLPGHPIMHPELHPPTLALA